VRAIANIIVLTPEGQPALNGTQQQEITPLPPGDANLEGAPYSGTERPPLLKARGVGLIPGGPGRELAAGFEQCEEKEVSLHIKHAPAN